MSADPKAGSEEKLWRLLEQVASEQPDSLDWLVRLLLASPAADSLQQVAGAWDIEPAELSKTIGKAVATVDRIEKPEASAHIPRSVCEAAVRFVATMRLRRLGHRRVPRKLLVLTGQIRASVSRRELRKWITAFIGVDA